MLIGAASRDITPPPGGQLSGYLYRVQPSVAVHDPLLVRALYLESDGERLLWLHADLIGWPGQAVREFRAWAAGRFGLLPRQIVLSATHTHAGPATIPLILCGDFDADYFRRLCRESQRAADEAIAQLEPVSLIVAEGHCGMAVDRRKTTTAHTDPRIGILGWKRPDGTYAAVLANYAMHNVALSHHNRAVSADVAGAAARRLAQDLSGSPTVLFTAGAGANLNPPHSGTDFAQVQALGATLAKAVVDALQSAQPAGSSALATAHTTLALELQHFDTAKVAAVARQACAAVPDDGTYERRRYREAVEIWRRKMLDCGSPDSVELELHLIRLGNVDLLCTSAEIFSRFADDLRDETAGPLYVVGYANGLIGYVAPAEAYDEGGYEVDSAFIFYGGKPLVRGAYEHVRNAAVALILTPPEPPAAPASPTAAEATALPRDATEIS
jgi:neutral ceramidase